VIYDLDLNPFYGDLPNTVQNIITKQPKNNIQESKTV